MKPATFIYQRADSVAAVAEALADPETRVLAGGQSLVPLMNLRLARPGTVVDVNGLAELDSIETSNGTVVLGSLCRHRRLELDPTIAHAAPLLAEAARHIGHPAIRNRGTLGGSLAHADPAGELGAALIALQGAVRVVNRGGERTIAATDLFTGFFTTSMTDDEFLVDVTVPSATPNQGSAFVEIAPRRGDFAVAGVAAVVTLDDDRRCASARLAGCGVASTPVDLTTAVSALVGSPYPDDDVLAATAHEIPRLFEPTADLRASAEDRRGLAQMLAVGALRTAWARATMGRDGE